MKINQLLGIKFWIENFYLNSQIDTFVDEDHLFEVKELQRQGPEATEVGGFEGLEDSAQKSPERKIKPRF